MRSFRYVADLHALSPFGAVTALITPSHLAGPDGTSVHGPAVCALTVVEASAVGGGFETCLRFAVQRGPGLGPVGSAIGGAPQ